MIFAEEPTNWKDLENRVAYILKGVGFSVKTEHNIETARGSVNIDVYAVKNKPSPPIHCLCECKYWNKNIPQSVIHSFRSVVSDSGANVGYIISKNGFQKGALETAENTNIIMFTWDQFLNNYKEEWHRSKIKELFSLAEPLKDYTSDFPLSIITDELDNMSEERNKIFYYIVRKYSSVSMESRTFGHTLNSCNEVMYERLEPPFILKWPDKDSEVILECTADYFDFLINTCTQGIEEFDEFFGKKLRRY